MTSPTAPVTPAAIPPAGDHPPADLPLRVLVVDDDEVDRLAVRRGLKRAGSAAQVDEASRGAEALAMLASHRYDCVFLDFNIPGSNGLSLLRDIRDSAADVPVVMLTGQGDERVAVELMKAGATDYMPKASATPERLASSLRYAVDLHRAATDARRAQEQVVVGAQRARFLAEASGVLASSLDVGPTLEGVARLAVPLLADYCFMFLVDAQGTASAITSAHADREKAALTGMIAQRYCPAMTHRTSIVAEVLRTGTTRLLDPVPPEYLAAISTSEEEVEAYRALNPASALAVPLVARTLLGVAMFCRSIPRAPFTADEVTLAEELARRAAMAIDNAMLYSEAQRARARTERLQAVTARLASVLPEDSVARIFVSEVREALGAATAWIALLSDDGRRLVARADDGFDPAAIARFADLPVDTAVPAREILRNGEPHWYESKAALLAAYPNLAESMADMSQEAVALLPLKVDSEVRGIITIGFREVRAFADEDRALATALAQQCTQALERARLYEAERASRAVAEEANRAKSEFLARMSHDLRTPLNAIGGYAQLIEDGIYGTTSQGQRQSLERIRRAQQHLLVLINDILSFAKLEAGQVNLTLEPVEVAGLVGELRTLIEPQAEAKGLRFAVREGEAIRAVADRARLGQILLNLLTNAVKFTAPGGSVEVRWSDAAGAARIQVRDTGTGIPAERLAAIFDPFMQVGTNIEATREGVGLGLAISKELARLMDGELSVESIVGQGSTFTITLPRAAEKRPVDTP